MLKVAVCDDDWQFCEKIRKILRFHFEGVIDCIDDFSSGEELMESIRLGNRYQMIFLDQEMKELDGVATAGAIRGIPEQQDTVLFFVTAYECEIVSVVDVHPFAYIRKPIDEDMFVASVKKAMEFINVREKLVIIKKKGGNIMLNPVRIQYTHACGHGCDICYDNHSVRSTMSINTLYEELCLKSELFVRVHRSYIVNIKYFREIEGMTIVMKDNSRIPLGQKYKEIFLGKCAELLL